MRNSVLAMAATAFAMLGCAHASAAPLQSGYYEGLVLAVSPTGRVVGHFDMVQGEGVTKRCAFDFVGQAKGGQATIRTIGSPALSGRLNATAVDELAFSMPRVKSLPGCGLVLPPEAESAGGTELDRIRAGSWSDLVRIKSARAAFRATSNGPAGRAYLVKGDVVGVLGKQGGAIKAVYPSERDHWSSGWLAAADVSPIG